MRDAAAAGALVLLLGLLAALRPTAVNVPAALPPEHCTAWMADAIPGVGSRRREAIAASIRSGDIPEPARGWFAPATTVAR